jgi:hypothetical protein
LEKAALHQGKTMRVWTGAIIKLDDGTLAQVTRVERGLVEAQTTAGETAVVHENIAKLASFDEIAKFRMDTQPPSAKHLAGQKKLEMN